MEKIQFSRVSCFWNIIIILFVGELNEANMCMWEKRAT